MAPKPHKRIDFLSNILFLWLFTPAVFLQQMFCCVLRHYSWKDLLKTDLLFMSLYLSHCAVTQTTTSLKTTFYTFCFPAIFIKSATTHKLCCQPRICVVSRENGQAFTNFCQGFIMRIQKDYTRIRSSTMNINGVFLNTKVMIPSWWLHSVLLPAFVDWKALTKKG